MLGAQSRLFADRVSGSLAGFLFTTLTGRIAHPTSNHQDYLSAHATFGGAAGALIRCM
jgi:hypothetical protein